MEQPNYLLGTTMPLDMSTTLNEAMRTVPEITDAP
jgi:hypothetical protein